MTGLAVLAAIVFLYVSDALYRSVVARAKSQFPSDLQEERKASYVLGAFIWQRSFPAELRRKYLWSIGFGALAAFCVVVIAYTTGHSNWAVFFASLLVLTVWNGLVGYTKSRNRP